jgi:hypothetical protein
MTRVITVFVLSAALATAAPWNLFRGKKGDKAKVENGSEQGFTTTYAGGTVAVVPRYVAGKLDLSNTKNLQFHYGKPTLTVPYSQITGIEVADATKESFLSLPVKKKRTVTIGWEDDKGTRNNAKFELGINESIEALPLLEERSGRAVTIAGMGDAEGWWGETAWKTTRNSHKWEPKEPTKPTLAAREE